MAEKATEQEPSIEEILASIRQIISDDDASAVDSEQQEPEESEPSPEPVVAAPPPPPPLPPPPPPPEKPKEDVLELKNPLPKAPEPPAEEPEPLPEKVIIEMRDTENQEITDDDSILTENAASATFSAFTKLANNTFVERNSGAGITIEDVVRDLLKPMLRDWLDVNLPPLIEKLVLKELDKIARHAMED